MWDVENANGSDSGLHPASFLVWTRIMYLQHATKASNNPEKANRLNKNCFRKWRNPLCLRLQPLDVVLEERRRRKRGELRRSDGVVGGGVGIVVAGHIQLAHLEVALAGVALKRAIPKRYISDACWWF